MHSIIMKKYLLLLAVLCCQYVSHTQTIKVMSYNVLTYPELGGLDRQDTLGKIIRYYQPDLFLIQELKSEEGFLGIVEEFNEWENHFAGGTYVDQISNPSNTWRLQQNLVYNTDIFSLIEEEVIVTDYRDVNYSKLYWNDSSAEDSTFIHVYNTHLKSSTGNQNEQLRLGMAEFITDHIRDLPADSRIIVAGDFNVYAGIEPAFQELIRDYGNNRLHDPIDTPNWQNNSFSHAAILTQSTRQSSPGNGSGGGVDDRFDFILISSVLKADSKLSYIPNSYKAYGNNGNCYNQDF